MTKNKSIAILITLLVLLSVAYVFLDSDQSAELNTAETASELTSHTSRVNMISNNSVEKNNPIKFNQQAETSTAIAETPPRRHNIIGNRDIERLRSSKLGTGSDQIEMDSYLSSNQPMTKEKVDDSQSFERTSGNTLAKTFLEVAYRQAIETGNPIANEIKQELEQFNQQIVEDVTAAKQQDNEEKIDHTTNTCDGNELECLCAKYPGYGDCETLKKEIEETPAHCYNRPPTSAGAFRCPCPGDADWRSNWKDFYSAELLRSNGCF